MKNDILTIMKKEFARFFGDKRMVLTSLILPGVMIYALYSFMGTALQGAFTVSDTYVPTVRVVNMQEQVMPFFEDGTIEVVNIEAADVEAAKILIASKELDLCVVFPEDFERIEAYDARMYSSLAPNIEVYYNNTSPGSGSAYGVVINALNSFEESMANKFDINRADEPGVEVGNLATEKDAAASMMSSLLPLLLMIFMFSGCMSIAPESIAGEKERGTIATLLVTPAKRSQLAAGKILSLGVIAFLCGLSSAIGTMLSLPNFMAGSGEQVSVAIYRTSDYAMLLLLILSTVLLIVSLLSVISAFARTVKEAGMAVMPLMIVVMLIGVTGMLGSGAQTEGIYYAIPFYNSVQAMSGIFSLEFLPANIIIACISNLIYALICGFALTKMFNSEKVMFSK